MTIDVKTFLKGDSDFNNYANRIEILSSQITSEDAYNKYLRINESIAISVYIQNDTILGFSSMLHRDIFNNGVRILNRFIKTEDYRFINTKREVSLETKSMIKQQLAIARELNFEFAFMSRSGSKALPAFMHYKKDLDFAQWHINRKRYRVCNYGKECCQYILWTPLRDNAVLNLTEVTEEEYNAL